MSICAKVVFSQNCRDVKKGGFREEIAFLVFVFFMLLQEKQEKEKKQNGKGPQNYRNSVFFSGGDPKMRKMKQMDF